MLQIKKNVKCSILRKLVIVRTYYRWHHNNLNLSYLLSNFPFPIGKKRKDRKNNQQRQELQLKILKKKLRIVIVIQGKIKEIVPDCDPSGVSDIKKHLKRKFMEKPSQDDNTPLDTDTEHHHITITICEQTRKKLTISVKKLGESWNFLYISCNLLDGRLDSHFAGKKISVQRSKGIGKKSKKT